VSALAKGKGKVKITFGGEVDIHALKAWVTNSLEESFVFRVCDCRLQVPPNGYLFHGLDRFSFTKRRTKTCPGLKPGTHGTTCGSSVDLNSFSFFLLPTLLVKEMQKEREREREIDKGICFQGLCLGLGVEVSLDEEC